MSKQEPLLYPEIEVWFNSYLQSKYSEYTVKTTYKSSLQHLEAVLRSFNIDPTLAIGLSIKIDILGVLSRDGLHELAFIEVKDDDLTLKDLGQLWGYSQLMDPLESFLISSSGIGGLSKLFNVLRREDLLKYGANNRLMQVAKWDMGRKSLDYSTLIPKQ